MTFTDPQQGLHIFGVTLIGVTSENGRKLLLTVALCVALWLAGKVLAALIGAAVRGERWPRIRFWARQSVHISTAAIGLIAIVSIWFDDPARLTTAVGLITAGIAFALQRVITAIAGYFVILRGKSPFCCRRRAAIPKACCRSARPTQPSCSGVISCMPRISIRASICA